MNLKKIWGFVDAVLRKVYVVRLLPEFIDFVRGDWFDPRQSFLKLPAFVVPLIFIAFFTFLIFMKIVADENLEFFIGGDMGEWVTWFKVPLATLALLIPVLGLFNANHKSEQTKATLESSKSQNIFANHYKHLEEFGKFVKGITGSDEQKKYTVDSIALYAHLFPASKSGDYRISPEVISKMHEVIDFFLEKIGKLHTLDESPLKDMIMRLEIQRGSFYSYFGYSFCVHFHEDDYSLSENVIKQVIGDMEYSVYIPHGVIANYFDWYSRSIYFLHRLNCFGDHYIEENYLLIKKITVMGQRISNIYEGRVQGGNVVSLPKYYAL